MIDRDAGGDDEDGPGPMKSEVQISLAPRDVTGVGTPLLPTVPRLSNLQESSHWESRHPTDDVAIRLSFIQIGGFYTFTRGNFLAAFDVWRLVPEKAAGI